MLRIVDYRGKWCAIVHIDGQRYRRSLGGLDATPENYPAAQRACVDLERALAQPDTDLVGDIVDAYLTAKENPDRPAITIDYMKWMWGVIKPHCAGLRVDQIDRKWCQEYAKKRGKAPATVRKEIGFLAAAIRWAGKPGAVIELPPEAPPRDRWLTKLEFSLLLEAAAPYPHLQVFLHLALATGARKEAILELTWEQVNWERGQIWLGRKPGGKARSIVPMTSTLRSVLRSVKQQYDALGVDCKRVVQYGGQPVGDIKKAFAGAVKRAGLKNVTPHDLRHTAAVWMAADGVSMEKIAQYLGHSDSRVTEKIYARFSPDHLKDAAAALDLGIRSVVLVNHKDRK